MKGILEYFLFLDGAGQLSMLIKLFRHLANYISFGQQRKF